MDPVRVLRVIARMNVGGPAIHATLLTEGLAARGYDTRLLIGSTSAAEGDYLELHGRRLSKVVEVPALGREIRPHRDLGAYLQIRRLIREFRPHIVHTHTAKAGLLGRLAGWRGHAPVLVHTFHGHVFHGYFSPRKEAAFVWAERQLAKVTDRLVTVSEAVRDEILARGVGTPGQFEIIRLGFDLDPFLTCQQLTGSLKAELNLPPATRLVGIVARLVPIKAHEVFIAMAADVASRHPDVMFAIVGDGERRQELEGMVDRRGLRARTRFLGWRADLDRVYADLDVVVLTSRNEGSPVALIEAMACARAVVATRVGGVSELVGDTGLLADMDDSAELARAVSRLLADPVLASHLGQAARDRVVPVYGKDRLIDDVDRLYRHLLMERS